MGKNRQKLIDIYPEYMKESEIKIKNTNNKYNIIDY